MGEHGFFCKVNTNDGTHDAAVEGKHTPVIKVDGAIKAGVPFSLTVDVGEGKHPNEHAHFIQWIDIYSNWVFIARVDLSAVTVAPKVTITTSLAHQGERTLRAFAKCNLHGVWETVTKVNVE